MHPTPQSIQQSIPGGSKRILVLGATGQIGYALTNQLARTEHRTKVLVRSRRVAFAPDVEVMEAPVFTTEVFADALAGVDAVVFGLGLPEQFVTGKDVFARVNHDLFESFLQALEPSPVRRLVYISTPEVFEVHDGVVREDHACADESDLSDYFSSKLAAYRLAVAFAERTGTALTTIHPSAVYGGRNTSEGISNFIENVVNRRFWKVPFIMPTRFGVVHADSLADAIVSSLDHCGAFIVSDQMTSLQEIAQLLQIGGGAYRPPMLPSAVATRLVSAGDRISRLLKVKPIMSVDQLDLLTRGTEPSADRARDILGWQPRPLGEGLQPFMGAAASRPGDQRQLTNAPL